LFCEKANQMNRLIQSGLMYGNLVHVASPALVERYNRALKHLTGRETALTDFYIDISGFSPEIGHELGDPLYLNHAGVNRQFILLSTAQKTAPLLDAKFSTSRSILRRFIDDNEPALFALTARDAVAGELVNSVYDMATPARLFDLRRITIEADTTGGALRHAAQLEQKIGEFLSRDDGWYDDLLIAEMIDLAGETGDITRNPIALPKMDFEQGNFWTAHFGGTYLFQTVAHPALITAGDRAPFDDAPMAHVFDLSQRNQIAKFLDLNKLVEPVIGARGIDAAAILRQKMEFILVDALCAHDITPGADSAALRRLAARHSALLPPEFHALNSLVTWAEAGGDWPRIASDHPAYFYTLRAADHPDADLVNMLLAELAPKDIRQLFICHKSLFYRLYASWPEAKKDYAVRFLKQDYQLDKEATRQALFAHQTPPPPPKRPTTGPWGPVRR
jgi:hypothetical protein